MMLPRSFYRIVATFTQKVSMHIISRDNHLGITNIPGINKRISSLSLCHAKLCLGMLTKSKRTCSSLFAFFKTVVLASPV